MLYLSPLPRITSIQRSCHSLTWLGHSFLRSGHELETPGGDILSFARRKKHSWGPDIIRTPDFIQQFREAVDEYPGRSM